MRTVNANGIDIALLEAGPPDGPLALCLHGFPDSAHTFRFLLPTLASAGFHTVAPFLRGYAPSAVPADATYDQATLAADANALHEVLGGDSRAVLIGHDWGAGIAYGASAAEPERWRRVVTAAVPPSGAMGAAFFDYDQIKRSFYIFFFQTPLAEVVVAMNDLEFIERLWADWSPGYANGEDVEHVKDALRDPANLTAAIGYYRAIFASGGIPGSGPQPTLYLHGVDDGCLSVELAKGAEAHLAPESRVELIEGAGHFMHVEKPDVVNELILEWVT
ncbi:MAG: alpha/beta hydrolase [Actinobacteria bacterium]|nr:alpha/beta hydrolase [Actinomycetota bacterium]